jgi:predicted enzyme related to lactoylglutathione lyase
MANNRVVHFEIPANDPTSLVKFYSDLFGWKAEKAALPGPEYWMVHTGEGAGISGAIMQRQDPRQPIVNYVDVPSIDEAIATATRLGGSVALPKQSIPGMGSYAAIVDPQGNICGLWELNQG